MKTVAYRLIAVASIAIVLTAATDVFLTSANMLNVLRQASLHVSALVKAAKTPAEKVAIASAHANWSVPALWVFLVSYLVLAAVTVAVYLRPGRERV